MKRLLAHARDWCWSCHPCLPDINRGPAWKEKIPLLWKTLNQGRVCQGKYPGIPSYERPLTFHFSLLISPSRFIINRSSSSLLFFPPAIPHYSPILRFFLTLLVLLPSGFHSLPHSPPPHLSFPLRIPFLILFSLFCYFFLTTPLLHLSSLPPFPSFRPHLSPLNSSNPSHPFPTYFSPLLTPF